MVYVRKSEKFSPDANDNRVNLELFADSKEDVTPNMTIEVVPGYSIRTKDLRPGTKLVTAAGEEAYLKSDKTWNWVEGGDTPAPTPGASNLVDLGDVDVSGVENGQALTYDSESETWKNTKVVKTMSDLLRPNNTPKEYDILTYTGYAWQSISPSHTSFARPFLVAKFKGDIYSSFEYIPNSIVIAKSITVSDNPKPDGSGVPWPEPSYEVEEAIQDNYIGKLGQYFSQRGGFSGLLALFYKENEDSELAYYTCAIYSFAGMVPDYSYQNAWPNWVFVARFSNPDGYGHSIVGIGTMANPDYPTESIYGVYTHVSYGG